MIIFCGLISFPVAVNAWYTYTIQLSQYWTAELGGKYEKVLIGVVVFLLLVGFTFICYQKTEKVDYYNGKRVEYISAIYAHDTTSPEKAIGVSDYVFVGIVKQILRTEYRNEVIIDNADNQEVFYDPYTVYEVEVIKNIKGNLGEEKIVELMRFGGLDKDGNS